MDFLMETRGSDQSLAEKDGGGTGESARQRGRNLRLCGPERGGKSTVMKMMMNLIHPDAGEARIFGERMGDESL